MKQSEMVTSPTLLNKLKHSQDDQAWVRFFEIYSPLIFKIARGRGFDQASGEDIVQETLVQLIKYLPRFNYDRTRGKFRSYLYKIILSNFPKQVKRKLPTESFETLDFSEMDFADPIPKNEEKDFERLRKENLVRLSLPRVQRRVQPLVWESFELYAIKGDMSADEVAAKLQIQDRNSIYQHKNRVIKILKAEVKKLEKELGDVDELDELSESELEGMDFRPLAYDNYLPGAQLKKRIRLLSKALINNAPAPSSPSQILVIGPGNSEWKALRNPFGIGSGGKNCLTLKSNFISQEHCRIICENDHWHIEDLGSKNGTAVNGNKIKKNALTDGDIIQISDILLIFSMHGNGLIRPSIKNPCDNKQEILT